MNGDFLDSSVILYVFDVDERKQEIAKSIVDDALGGGVSISFQVVQEVLNVLIRKGATPASDTEARNVLETVLLPLWHVMPTRELYTDALRIQARYRYSFYDSLIIAAALQAGCARLLSEDLQHGQRIEGLTIVNPFAGTASR